MKNKATVICYISHCSPQPLDILTPSQYSSSIKDTRLNPRQSPKHPPIMEIRSRVVLLLRLSYSAQNKITIASTLGCSKTPKWNQ